MEEAKPLPKAIIFDCDGTLVDTETPYMSAFNKALQETFAGEGEAPKLNEEVWGRDCCGRGLEYDAKYAVTNFNLSCSADEFLVRWKSNFAKLIAEPGSITLLPGFDDLMSFARSQGFKCGVASSSDRHGLKLKLTNGVVANSKVLSSLDGFDTVVSNDDVTKHKPDPEIYLLAAERLGVPAAACCVSRTLPQGFLLAKMQG